MASSYPRDEALVEIGERLSVMREQEATHYAVPDYLAAAWQQRLWDAAPASSSSRITEAWRREVCEWCYRVVDRLEFDREVVSVAMSYLDRYLAVKPANRCVLQLAAMTALHLAVKLFEPGKLRTSSLVKLGGGRFLVGHVVAMEESMLRNLGWRVHPPTPLAFCRLLGGLLGRDWTPGARRYVEDLSRFLTELSVCDYWFATRRPSSVALASVVNAVELRAGPRDKVEFLRRVADAGVDVADDDAEIVECYQRLGEIYIAGGYQAAADPEGGEEGRPTRFTRTSPVGVEDGPDAPGEEEDGECA